MSSRFDIPDNRNVFKTDYGTIKVKGLLGSNMTMEEATRIAKKQHDSNTAETQWKNHLESMNPIPYENQDTVEDGLNDIQQQNLDWQLQQNAKNIGHSYSAAGIGRSGAAIKKLKDTSNVIANNAYQEALQQQNQIQNTNFENSSSYLTMLQDQEKARMELEQRQRDFRNKANDKVTDWGMTL